MGESLCFFLLHCSSNFNYFLQPLPIGKKFDLANVFIYYGSQTGTAKKYSHFLSETLAKKNINSVVQNLSKFDPDETFQTCLVCIF